MEVHAPLLESRSSTLAAAYDSWSWPSQFLFLYSVPTLLVGSKNGRLSIDDIPDLASRDEPARAFVNFERSRDGSILRRLLALYWLPWIYSGFLVLLATAGTIGSPFVMHKFLSFLSEHSAKSATSYLWALALGSCSAITALTLHKVRFCLKVGDRMIFSISHTTGTISSSLSISRLRCFSFGGRLHVSVSMLALFFRQRCFTQHWDWGMLQGLSLRGASC